MSRRSPASTGEPMAWEGHEEDSDDFLPWQRQWLEDRFAPEHGTD